MADSRTLDLVIDAKTEVARRNLQAFADALGVSLEEAEARIARFDARLNIVGSGFAKASGLIVGGLAAIGTAAIAGGYALSGIVEKAVDFGGSIGDVAGKVGVTTDFLQQFRFAATQTGATTAQADGALNKFNETIGKAAEGNKTAAGAFDFLKVKLDDTNGNLKPTEQLFREVADAIAKLPDPARQSAEAVKFFGEAGTNILGLLKQGSSGFDTLAESAGKLGLVLTPAVIQNLNDLGSKAAALKQIVDTKLAAAVGQNATALLALAEGAASAINAIGALVSQIQGLRRIGDYQGKFQILLTSGQTAEAAADPIKYKAILQKNVDTARKKFGDGTGIFSGSAAEDVASAQAILDRYVKSPEYQAALRPATAAATQAAGGKVRPVAVKTPKPKAGPKPKIDNDPLGLRDVQKQAVPNSLDKLDTSFSQFDQKSTFEGAFAEAKKLGGAELDPAYLRGIKTIADETERAARASSRFNSDLARGLADAIVYGGSLGDVLVNTFKRAAAEALESGIFDLLGGGSRNTGDKAGGFVSLAKTIGSLFGGAHADGSDAPGGKISLVGERGPELIMPKGTMTVIPNHLLGGGRNNDGNISIYQTIAPNFAGNAATREDVLMMGQIAKQQAIAGVKDAMSRRGGWR